MDAVSEDSLAAGVEPLAGLVVGSQVAGYRLEERVGAGGMAVVFRATDARLGRRVALKVLAPSLATDDTFRRRFVRESHTAAAVDDPHIIPVYEAGEARGVLFIAMRFVPGGDVRTLLRQRGPLPPIRAAAIVSPVASALDAAHAAGLVHRDVKPANMLVDIRPGRPDHVYLSDFGLSKAALSSTTGLTRSGQALGTPDYMAPEQIEGRPVDGRTDQYALACSAFEMLTGVPPFQRDQGMAVVWAHLQQSPPPLGSLRAGLPKAADGVFARGMAKKPSDRYDSCREFADALRAALGVPSYQAGHSDEWAASHPLTEVVPPVGHGADEGTRPGVAPSADDAEAVYSEALAAFWTERYGQAEELLRRVLVIQPGHPGAEAKLRQVGERLEGARRQQQIAELRAEAQRLHQAGQWAAVIGVGERLRALDPAAADPEGLVSSARAELAAAKQAEQMEADYRAALNLLDAGEWQHALAVLDRIGQVNPAYRATPELLARARREVASGAQTTPPPRVFAPTEPPVAQPWPTRPIRRGAALAGSIVVLLAGAADVAGNAFPPPLHAASYVFIVFFLASMGVAALALARRQLMVLAALTGLWSSALPFLAGDLVIVIADHSFGDTGSSLAALRIAQLADLLGVAGLVFLAASVAPAAAKLRVRGIGGQRGAMIGVVALCQLAIVGFYATFTYYKGFALTQGITGLAVSLALAWYAVTRDSRKIGGAMVLGWAAVTAAYPLLSSFTDWSSQTGVGRVCLAIASLFLIAVVAITCGYMLRPAESRELQQHADNHL